MRSFGVAQQPVQTARDVAQMKRHGASPIGRALISASVNRRTTCRRLPPPIPAHAAQLVSRHRLPLRSAEPGSTAAFVITIPVRARNSRTTSPTSSCLPSTASFIACTSSALTLPASRSIATWISGCLAQRVLAHQRNGLVRRKVVAIVGQHHEPQRSNRPIGRVSRDHIDLLDPRAPDRAIPDPSSRSARKLQVVSRRRARQAIGPRLELVAQLRAANLRRNLHRVRDGVQVQAAAHRPRESPWRRYPQSPAAPRRARDSAEAYNSRTVARTRRASRWPGGGSGCFRIAVSAVPVYST